VKAIAIGAVLGAVLAYLIVSLPVHNLLRRSSLAISGVLAQFGGVVLAFAWIATIGPVGVVTQAMSDFFGADVYGNGWLFGLPGLVVVYSYFQVPLMVIVFAPAFDGLRPQWREAAVNLGANTWTYWRYVALPLLTPPFLGALLLLFANAFAAYATAAVLVSQGQPILPLMIRQAITSEVLLGQANVGFALALEMIVVVTVVMVGYNLLLRRTARWMR
jgi:putative spermidine/putrescine transport system permease protein